MAGAALPIAIGIGSALSAYGQSRSADRAADLSEAELEFLRQRYAEQEPLRAMGLARLQGPLPERPDQSGAFADPSNPFAVSQSAIGFGKGYRNQPPNMQQSLNQYGKTMEGVNKRQTATNTAKARDKVETAFPGVLGTIEGDPAKDIARRQAAIDRGVDPRVLKAMGFGL
jgi:hypothetical protein